MQNIVLYSKSQNILFLQVTIANICPNPEIRTVLRLICDHPFQYSLPKLWKLWKTNVVPYQDCSSIHPWSIYWTGQNLLTKINGRRGSIVNGLRQNWSVLASCLVLNSTNGDELQKMEPCFWSALFRFVFFCSGAEIDEIGDFDRIWIIVKSKNEAFEIICDHSRRSINEYCIYSITTPVSILVLCTWSKPLKFQAAVVLSNSMECLFRKA
jgi:hypothetical protein